MFEVSWCVGLYVTVLLIEFLPVPFERWGLQRAMEIWRKWSGYYMAFALTLFVYLLSRKLIYAALTAVLFSLLAWIFRARDKRAEPIMLAIAAVTLSTMHQSSLGSLFLLMPDKLAPQWWSPVMPISFFLSSIVAGTGLVILMEMWIAKGWGRQLRTAQLAALGKITFWSLMVYLLFRLGDMAVRGEFAYAFSGRLGLLFVAEIVLGAIVPLILLAAASSRARPTVLLAGALFATLGVVLNRVDVVLWAMDLRGPMPQIAPEAYSPTIFEWGISWDSSLPRSSSSGLVRGYCLSFLRKKQARGEDPMTVDMWLARHPYLQPVADLQAQVAVALAEISAATAAIPHWDSYVVDFHNGVPLLHSAAAGMDLVPAESTLRALFEKLVPRLPEKLAHQATVLNIELTGDLAAAGRVAKWLLDKDDNFTIQTQGLLRYLGWTVLARYLSPVVDAFAAWRDEERWFRNYCPTCGSRPAMGQLLGIDPGRRRFLVCGRCNTRWWFHRIGCPFCEVENGHRLTALTVEGEGGLRIDYCNSCGGYLKTYDGQGSECVLLADWTSIHLDVIACDRGLNRLGGSLYEVVE